MRSQLLGAACLALVTLPGFLACRATSNGTSTPVPSTTESVAIDGSAPSPVDRGCSRDEDCAVARVETSGAHVCCAACGTTPGTRKWHAKLQAYCAAHAPTNCYPLACPMGRTRAICRAGQCEATATGADGGTTFVMDDRQCLPAMVCDAWKGCAEVVGNDQDDWFVRSAEVVKAGELASIVGNACTDGSRCPATRVHPADVVCPPYSIPPIIGAPGFVCAFDSRGTCRKTL